MSIETDYLPTDPEVLWQTLVVRLLPEDRTVAEKAFEIASRVHAGQTRKTMSDISVPYIIHPLRVATILVAEWDQLDRITVLTALLHDVLEDCRPQPHCRMDLAEEIILSFGLEVHDAVWKLTKPQLAPTEAQAVRDARYFADIRIAPESVRLVKCADRLDNLRDAIAWGDTSFWEHYSSDTIGWHLFLARETSPVVEHALFKAIVDGERSIRGSVPMWADGYLIDPVAAKILPEHVSRRYAAVGLALQGDMLVLGVGALIDERSISEISLMVHRPIVTILVSEEAIRDAQRARMYG